MQVIGLTYRIRTYRVSPTAFNDLKLSPYVHRVYVVDNMLVIEADIAAFNRDYPIEVWDKVSELSVKADRLNLYLEMIALGERSTDTAEAFRTWKSHRLQELAALATAEVYVGN